MSLIILLITFPIISKIIFSIIHNPGYNHRITKNSSERFPITAITANNSLNNQLTSKSRIVTSYSKSYFSECSFSRRLKYSLQIFINSADKEKENNNKIRMWSIWTSKQPPIELYRGAAVKKSVGTEKSLDYKFQVLAGQFPIEIRHLPSLAPSMFLGWPVLSEMIFLLSAALRSCSRFSSSAAFFLSRV